jgi:hypothetical protein
VRTAVQKGGFEVASNWHLTGSSVVAIDSCSVRPEDRTVAHSLELEAVAGRSLEQHNLGVQKGQCNPVAGKLEALQVLAETPAGVVDTG